MSSGAASGPNDSADMIADWLLMLMTVYSDLCVTMTVNGRSADRRDTWSWHCLSEALERDRFMRSSMLIKHVRANLAGVGATYQPLGYLSEVHNLFTPQLVHRCC